MPKRALEGRSTKRRRPAKVPRNDDLSLQAEPVSDEPVSRAEPVSSDAINYDLLAAAILRQSQTLSQNQTNSSDTTMDILQPCVQNQGDIEAHAHPMASQQTTTATVSDNQPQQNIADLVSALLQQDGQDKRPKRLLVFINPRSGSGKAEKIYAKRVLPVFELCEIQTNVIGSGNYTAWYLNGTKCPVTAALRIVMGHCVTTNIVSLHQRNKCSGYSGLILGFGLFGDVMRDSEKYRWMGTSRFKEWKTAEDRVLYAVDTYPITMKPDGTRMTPNFGGDTLELLITTKCKLTDHFRQLKAVDDGKSSCYDFEFVKKIQVQRYRVRVLRNKTDDFYLNCDGGVIRLEHPELMSDCIRRLCSFMEKPNK